MAWGNSSFSVAQRCQMFGHPLSLGYLGRYYFVWWKNWNDNSDFFGHVTTCVALLCYVLHHSLIITTLWDKFHCRYGKWGAEVKWHAQGQQLLDFGAGRTGGAGWLHSRLLLPDYYAVSLWNRIVFDRYMVN